MAALEFDSNGGVPRPNRRNLSKPVAGNICLSDSVQKGKFLGLITVKRLYGKRYRFGDSCGNIVKALTNNNFQSHDEE